MGKEFELKYAASAAVLEEIEAVLGGCAEKISMQTTYFDTPARALSARKWTLRLRKENEACVVTFKTAGDGTTRGEWEYPAESLDGAADRLTALGAPEELKPLLAEGLTPVCGAAFTRRALTVEHGSATLEVALDAGNLFREGKTLPIFEVEVELKQGDEAACRNFAANLAEKFHLCPESRSKFVRAVNL